MFEGRSTTTILLVCGLLWAGIVLHNIAQSLDNSVFEASVSQAEVQRYARAQLAEAQERSFAEDIEYCGVIAENSAGELVSQTITTRSVETCGMSWFDVDRLLPVATFHTHAAHNEEYDSEVPSMIDLNGDVASGMDGYVGTPGGRFWHIDAARGEARQVCGEGCLPRDANYRPCPAWTPEPSYTRETLGAREARIFAGC